MVQVTLGGKTWDVAPYKIGAMRQAAPFIDAINSKAGSMTSIAAMTEAAGDFIAVLLVGIRKIDSSVTQESLEDVVGMEDLVTLRDAFQGILVDSGMIQAGEIPAPEVTEALPEALPSASDASSTS